MKMRRSLLLLAAAPALWTGCMPDVPGPDPEPAPRVSAVFDADTATIPLPNTAALEADGTLPKLPGAGEDTANGAFLDWLDGLHGWSESTPVTIPFSGELDPATVTTDNVKMFRHDADGATELPLAAVRHVPNTNGAVCNESVCGAIILAVPADTPEFGKTYSIVVTKDVKGANGAEVGESSAVFFAASPSPIVTEEGEITIGVLEDDPETANSLEGLRRLLTPTFAAAAEAGIPRDRVASAQSWTVAADPFTVLDPATATLPIPNTLAIEADGTFPSAALSFCGGPGVDLASLDTSCGAPGPEYFSCEATADCDQYREDGDPASQCVGGRCVFTRCAQGQFDAYLDGLHGWPTTTPITLPVTGAIDTATLNDTNVQLFAVVEGVPTKIEGTTVALSECGDEITITLPADAPAMGYATNYFAFATKDVLGENGLPLLPPAAVLLAMMPNEPGEFVGDCAPEAAGEVCDGGGVCGGIPGVGFKCVESLVPNASDDQAASVMAIRPLFQPTVAAANAAAGVEWSDLASIWTWSTWTDTFVVFDPLAGNIPFPHTLLTNGCPSDQPICGIPDGQGATAPIIEALKRRDGFSSTAPHWIPTLGPPLDPASVITSPANEAGVLFAEADEIPPPLFPADEWAVSYEFDNIIARFNRPLKPDILVAGLTTTNLMGSNGFPAQPTPAFVFLRSEYPLVDSEGNRTIREIPNNETAAVLEASRQDFEQLFLVALLFGYGRAEINNAWAFTTGETYKPLQRLRAQTIFEMGGAVTPATANSPDVETAPFDAGNVPDPDMMTTDVDVSNLAAIHWNTEFDTYNWLAADNSFADSPVAEAVGVSVFIPGGTCTPPYDVAIAQHGLGGYRKNAGLAVANTMAANCIATVAMDLPLHGGRIAGSPELHPASRPATSGDGYVNEDFVGTVNRFQQAVIDQVVLVRLIKEGGFDAAVGEAFSDDTSQVGYIGSSMGAFAGALLTTVEPDLGPTILNVGGGNFGTILKDSEAFNPILQATGIPADTFAEIQALHFVQWLGEHADPYAFAPYPVLNPVAEITYDGTAFANGDTLPAKDVIIQMVTGDTVVPNSATEPLARVMGVSLDDTTFPATTPHGFLGVLDSASPAAPAKNCAVDQAAEWMSSAFGGTAALTTSAACASSL